MQVYCYAPVASLAPVIAVREAGIDIHAARIGVEETDLLLATHAVVANNPDSLRKFISGRGAVVVNADETSTANIVTDRDAILPTSRMLENLLNRAGDKGFAFSATCIAERLFGNSVAANTMIIGYAWQKGALPLSLEAINEAITINGVAVELNKRAFAWGRLAVVDLEAVELIAGIEAVAKQEEGITENNEEYMKLMSDNTPTGRAFMDVSDIAGAAVFLASDDAVGMHGAVMPVDDGWTA